MSLHKIGKRSTRDVRAIAAGMRVLGQLSPQAGELGEMGEPARSRPRLKPTKHSTKGLQQSGMVLSTSEASIRRPTTRR